MFIRTAITFVLCLYSCPTFAATYHDRGANNQDRTMPHLIERHTHAETPTIVSTDRLCKMFESFEHAFNNGYYNAALAFAENDPNWSSKNTGNITGYFTSQSRSLGVSDVCGFLVRHHEVFNIPLEALQQAYKNAFTLSVQRKEFFESTYALWCHEHLVATPELAEFWTSRSSMKTLKIFHERRGNSVLNLITPHVVDELFAQSCVNEDSLHEFFSLIKGAHPSEYLVRQDFLAFVKSEEEGLVRFMLEKCPFSLSPETLKLALNVRPRKPAKSLFLADFKFGMHPIHKIINAYLGVLDSDVVTFLGGLVGEEKISRGVIEFSEKTSRQLLLGIVLPSLPSLHPEISYIPIEEKE